MKLQRAQPATFQEQTVPQGTRLVGAAALVHALAVAAPVRRSSCVADQHVSGSRRADGAWTVFDKRYWPGDELANHLTFLLKHEEADLLVLRRIFDALPQREIEALVRAAPSATHIRRAWFLYETLTGRTIDAVDAPRVAAIELLDPKAYFTGKPRLSKRHRVRDNLLGTGRYSPVIRRTAALEQSLSLDLAARARETVGRAGAHLIARAASFLLLADSRASFQIEGERPPRNRLERWGRAVLQAGKNTLTFGEIIRLHNVLIEDTRFVHAGLRTDGVFLGERDHLGDPLPEFIGARAQDLADLMAGMLEANDRMRDDGIDPVLQAAATAFGFVYIHPFEDGNGRFTERGLEADHTTIWRWVQRYGPELEQRLRRHLKPTTKSWRVDETYVRVKGRWYYLYRAIDSRGATIDFVLSALRDAAAARRLFRKALTDPSHPQPRVINTDQARLYGAAIPAVKTEGTLRRRCRHRPVRYLNNILEQDHRAIKRRVKAKQGFREFHAARRTIEGYEAMHMIRKGQVRRVSGSDVRRQIQFIDKLFEVVA